MQAGGGEVASVSFQYSRESKDVLLDEKGVVANRVDTYVDTYLRIQERNSMRKTRSGYDYRYSRGYRVSFFFFFFFFLFSVSVLAGFELRNEASSKHSRKNIIEIEQCTCLLQLKCLFFDHV